MFTVAKLNAHGEKLESPKVVALIEIDGTNSSMIGIIKTNDIEKDFGDMKVKAVLRSKDKREGTMKDILYWKMDA